MNTNCCDSPEQRSLPNNFLLRPFRTWGTLLVAQLVEELRYKSAGRRFDSRWCHWNFSLT